MKKLLSLCLALSLVFALAGCGQSEREQSGSGKLHIVTTLFPAYDFARNVAGECATVTLLVPPGSEAHSYEPTPQDIIRIRNCDLLIANGGESEAWLEELLEGQDGEVNVLYMLEEVDALVEEEKEGMQDTHEHAHDEHDHDEHDHEHEEEEYDEHVWTSPVNAQKITRAICERLSELDGGNAAEYARHTERYCEELQRLDEAFREVVQSAQGDTLIFADRFPARYFVEEYGLDYFAAFPGCADDTEPSARTVAFLIDRVKEEHIPAVLYIEYSNQKMADVVCEDTHCQKALFHTCHTVSAEDLQRGASYLSLMWGNVESVKEALG